MSAMIHADFRMARRSSTVDLRARCTLIMGPNGSGKSTLAYVLTGREGYEVTGTAR